MLQQLGTFRVLHWQLKVSSQLSTSFLPNTNAWKVHLKPNLDFILLIFSYWNNSVINLSLVCSMLYPYWLIETVSWMLLTCEITISAVNLCKINYWQNNVGLWAPCCHPKQNTVYTEPEWPPGFDIYPSKHQKATPEDPLAPLTQKSVRFRLFPWAVPSYKGSRRKYPGIPSFPHLQELRCFSRTGRSG